MSAANQKAVDDANVLSDLFVDVLHVVADHGRLGLLEFPEDLGKTVLGRPASLWQDQGLRALAARGFQRGVFYQDEWADIAYVEPTGLLTNIEAIGSNPRFHVGWPVFKADGSYAGPLPPRSSYGVGLIGKSASGEFATKPSAAYPPGVVMTLAAAILTS